MHVVTIASQKGGAGKTTIAAMLGTAAEQAGRSVAWIDLDPQNSLTALYKARESSTPILLQSDPKGLREHLRLCRSDGVERVYIDTPPATSREVVAAVKAARLVVVPVRAASLDIIAIQSTVDLIESLGKPGLIVLNFVRGATRDARDARAALEGYTGQGVELAALEVPLRVAYARAYETGATCNESAPKSDEAKIVRLLYREIEEWLEKGAL